MKLFHNLKQMFHSSQSHAQQTEGVMLIPEHVAIIMDGNGRWAEKRGLPRAAGHKSGALNLKKVTARCTSLGVKYLTVYAFSTENWKRPQSEVDYLMNLLIKFLDDYRQELADQDIRLCFLGEREGLSDLVKSSIAKCEAEAKDRQGMWLVIAFNYGGRREIVNACRRYIAANGSSDLNSLNETELAKYLYMPDLPNPDVIVRTGGEMRLSNFLLWQSAYAELVSTDKLWPDFDNEDLDLVLKEFARRTRKFGGLKK